MMLHRIVEIFCYRILADHLLNLLLILWVERVRIQHGDPSLLLRLDLGLAPLLREKDVTEPMRIARGVREFGILSSDRIANPGVA